MNFYLLFKTVLRLYHCSGFEIEAPIFVSSQSRLLLVACGVGNCVYSIEYPRFTEDIRFFTNSGSTGVLQFVESILVFDALSHNQGSYTMTTEEDIRLFFDYVDGKRSLYTERLAKAVR